MVGEAAWTETCQNVANCGRLTRAAGEAAIERARITRDEYYSRRYEELAVAGYLEFGVAVARAVCASGHRIRKVDVDEIARRHCGEGWKAAVDFTVQKGFSGGREPNGSVSPAFPA